MNMYTVCMYIYTYIMCVCICIYIYINMCVCVIICIMLLSMYYIYTHIHICTLFFTAQKPICMFFFTNASILIWSVSCLKINNGEHVCDIDFYRGYV